MERRRYQNCGAMEPVPVLMNGMSYDGVADAAFETEAVAELRWPDGVATGAGRLRSGRRRADIG